MNWQEVKEKYPLAWSAFEAWLIAEYLCDYVSEDGESSIDEIIAGGDFGVYWFYNGDAPPVFTRLEVRIAYSFFDAKNMYVRVNYSGGFPFDLRFAWDIDLPNENPRYIPSTKEATRTLAESAAFTKAFSILESQLKGQA